MARIFSKDDEIEERLKPFGVNRSELVSVVRHVVGARADTTAYDPLAAKGLLAYIYGTRSLRQIFGQKGWLIDRLENIEATRHPDLALKIVYQNVDLAASILHSPKAVSGKGSGADRIVDSAQGQLVLDLEPGKLTSVREINSGIWFFCVSVRGDDVRAELSLPSAISDSNFGEFLERIFIVREGEWSTLRVAREPGPRPAEIEPVVMRKK